MERVTIQSTFDVSAMSKLPGSAPHVTGPRSGFAHFHPTDIALRQTQHGACKLLLVKPNFLSGYWIRTCFETFTTRQNLAETTARP